MIDFTITIGNLLTIGSVLGGVISAAWKMTGAHKLLVARIDLAQTFHQRHEVMVAEKLAEIKAVMDTLQTKEMIQQQVVEINRRIGKLEDRYNGLRADL